MLLEKSALSKKTQGISKVKIAAVTMHSKMGDVHANLDHIEFWTHKAHKAGATFAVFPEECVTGSLNKSNITKKEAIGICERASKETRIRLEAICKKMQMTLVVGTIEKEKRGAFLQNNALIVGPDGY